MLLGCSDKKIQNGYQNDPKVLGSIQIRIDEQDVKKYMDTHRDEDLIQGGVFVYKNAEKDENIGKLKIEKGRYAMTIGKKYNKNNDSYGVYATKLPIGTEVYVSEPIQNPEVLIAMVNGKEIRYILVHKPNHIEP